MNTHHHTHLFIATACTLALGMALSNTYLLALGIGPVQAITQSDQEAVTASRIVSFGDLAIATPAGREALTERLRLAAKAVCDEIRPAHYWWQRDSPAQCRQTVMRQAFDKVYSPGSLILEPFGATPQDRSVELTAHR